MSYYENITQSLLSVNLTSYSGYPERTLFVKSFSFPLQTIYDRKLQAFVKLCVGIMYMKESLWLKQSVRLVALVAIRSV